MSADLLGILSEAEIKAFMLKGVIAAIVGLIFLVIVVTWVAYVGLRHGWWHREAARPAPAVSSARSTSSVSVDTQPAPAPQLKKGGAVKRQTNVSCVGRPKGVPFSCGSNSPTGVCVCP